MEESLDFGFLSAGNGLVEEGFLRFGWGTFCEEIGGGAPRSRWGWGWGGGERDVGGDVEASRAEKACVPLGDYGLDSDFSESFSGTGVLDVRRAGL